jgi:hypothetical protein
VRLRDYGVGDVGSSCGNLVVFFCTCDLGSEGVRRFSRYLCGVDGGCRNPVVF